MQRWLDGKIKNASPFRQNMADYTCISFYFAVNLKKCVYIYTPLCAWSKKNGLNRKEAVTGNRCM